MNAGMLVIRPPISGSGTTSRTGITTLPAENWDVSLLQRGDQLIEVQQALYLIFGYDQHAASLRL